MHRFHQGGNTYVWEHNLAWPHSPDSPLLPVPEDKSETNDASEVHSRRAPADCRVGNPTAAARRCLRIAYPAGAPAGKL